jgi:hypothetical protein
VLRRSDRPVAVVDRHVRLFEPTTIHSAARSPRVSPNVVLGASVSVSRAETTEAPRCMAAPGRARPDGRPFVGKVPCPAGQRFARSPGTGWVGRPQRPQCWCVSSNSTSASARSTVLSTGRDRRSKRARMGVSASPSRSPSPSASGAAQQGRPSTEPTGIQSPAAYPETAPRRGSSAGSPATTTMLSPRTKIPISPSSVIASSRRRAGGRQRSRDGGPFLRARCRGAGAQRRAAPSAGAPTSSSQPPATRAGTGTSLGGCAR